MLTALAGYAAVAIAAIGLYLGWSKGIARNATKQAEDRQRTTDVLVRAAKIENRQVSDREVDHSADAAVADELRRNVRPR